VGKYGTNLEGFGAFEGGVNADKGAPLVSTSSDGETALLFGPAALREIQAGVANGDFAIPPDEADATITAENPLPYWTFTDTSSAGAITCALVNDATSASTNALRWTVAANTSTGKSASLSRYIAVPGTRDKSYAFWPEVYVRTELASRVADRQVTMTLEYFSSDLTSVSTAITHSFVFSALNADTLVFEEADTPARLVVPSNASLAKLTISVDTTGTNVSAVSIDMYEVKLLPAPPILLLADRSGVNGPSAIWQNTAALWITASVPTDDNGGLLSTLNPYIKVAATNIELSAPTVNVDGVLETAGGSGGVFLSNGDIGFDGEIYGTTALTGPHINLGGTNTRLWVFSDSAADLVTSTSTTRSGVLVTKSTAGQPSTNINGVATTDAFADSLRNGGIAVDTTNNRAYFYSSGWKFVAVAAPSDSRLKEEITEITGALDTLRQLVPVAFKWKAPEAHGRTDAVADDGKRLGFIADQVATTDLAHWVETLGVDDREAHLVDTTEVLAVNIPQNEMEALVVQALLDIDTRLKALEAR